MGGRGASSGSIGSKSTPDGKYTVGNTYRMYNESIGYDYDFVITDATEKEVIGRITKNRPTFRVQSEGDLVHFSTNSTAYKSASLIKESEKNATVRGNRQRREINQLRKNLDKANIKYPAGAGLDDLRYRWKTYKTTGYR